MASCAAETLCRMFVRRFFFQSWTLMLSLLETVAESCQMLIYRFSERVHDTSWWLLPGEARSIKTFGKA